MLVMCPFCMQEYEDTKNSFCPSCGNLKEIMRMQDKKLSSLKENPLEGLVLEGIVKEALEPKKYFEQISIFKEITGKIMRKEIPFTKEKLEEVYTLIVELLQDILNKSKRELDENLQELTRLGRLEQTAELDKGVKKIFTVFEEAQNKITNGLNTLGESLRSAKSFTELENKLIEVEAAASRITEGLTKLEFLTQGSRDPELLKEPDLFYPPAVMEATDLLQKCLENIERFYEKGNKDELRACLPLLEETKTKIRESLN
jgi:hypothetical protein